MMTPKFLGLILWISCLSRGIAVLTITNPVLTLSVNFEANNSQDTIAVELRNATSPYNIVETIKVYNKNTISLITNSHDKLEHKLDKLLALSDSPANELPIDRLVLSKPLVMKLVQDVYEGDDIILYKNVEVSVKAIHLDKTYNSGIACETDKGLLDMGLLVK